MIRKKFPIYDPCSCCSSALNFLLKHFLFEVLLKWKEFHQPVFQNFLMPVC